MLLRRLVVLALALSGLTSSTGCGYRMVKAGGGLGSARSVSVVTLRNDSSQPGVERLVSEALRKELLNRGQLRVVSNPGSADLVLRGTVYPFVILAESVSSVAGALEYSITLQLDLRVEGQDGFEFKVPDMVNAAIYPASADLEVTRKNRTEALRHIADVLADRALDSIELRLAP
jgi:hypothetical protein